MPVGEPDSPKLGDVEVEVFDSKGMA